jgi:hypothetical protein
VDDKIAMNDLETQIETILKLHKLSSDDNLYHKIIEAITENGIDGFYKFKEEIAPKKFNAILNSFKDLTINRDINQNRDESIYDFNNFIEQYLDRFEINKNDDKLKSKIKELLVEKMLQSLQEFKNQIDFVKLEKALLAKKEKIKSNNFNSITKFLKLFLVDLKITTDESFILKIINHALDCFKKVLKNFVNVISPNNMEELVSSINLEIDHITANNINYTSESITQENTAKPNKENTTDKLVELKKKLSKMPVCLEESILSLIFSLNLKKEKEVTSYSEFQDFLKNLDEDIKNKLSLLSERLKIEQDNNENLKKFYDELLKKIKFEEWNLALELLESILKQIRPLDIDELKFLMEKAREAADKIKNQDVILLMGKTGIKTIDLYIKIKKNNYNHF